MKSLVCLLVFLLVSPAAGLAQTSDIVWSKGGGHFGAITATALSADGSLFVAVDAAGRVLVRARDSGETLRVIHTRRAGSSFMHFLGDGRDLLLAYSDEVVIWNIETGSARRFPVTMASLVGAWPLEAVENLLLVGEDGIGAVFEIATGDSVDGFDLGMKGIVATRIFANESGIAFMGEDRVLRAWDLRSRSILHTAIPLQMYGIRDLYAVTPRNSLALTGHSDSVLAIWDLRSGSLVDTFSIVPFIGEQYFNGFVMLPMIGGAAFSPNGDSLILHSNIDARIGMYDLRTHTLLQEFGDGFAHSAVPVIDMTGLGITSTFMLSADRRDLWMTVQKNPTSPGGARPDIFMARFTLSPDRGTPPIERLEFTPNQEPVRDVTIAPDGRFAASVAGQTLITWSLPEGTYDQVRRPLYPDVAYMAVGPDARSVASYQRIYIADGPGSPGTFEAWGSMGQGPIPLPLPLSLSVDYDQLAISPASRYALIGDRIYSSRSFVTLPFSGFAGATFSSDTIHLALIKQDSILLWNCERRTLERTLQPNGRILSMAFSRDGASLGCGLESGQIVVYDVGTGLETARLTGHSERIRALAFSRDDLFLVSSSADSTIWTWELETQKNLYIYRENPGITTALDATPDGRYILAGTDEGAVMLYDARWGSVSVPGRPALDIVQQIHPNPLVGERLVVSLRGYSGDLQIDLIDMAGTVVAAFRSRVVDGASVELNVAGLPAGSYLCHVSAGGSSQSRLVVIAR